MCPYAFYKKVEDYSRELIYCKRSKGICPYTRYCNRLNKIIPSDSMDNCVMSKEIQIPEGASRVRKEISDLKYLYVDIEKDGSTFTNKIKNTFDYIPDFVYVDNV